MKKILPIIAAGLVAASSAFGQTRMSNELQAGYTSADAQRTRVLTAASIPNAAFIGMNQIEDLDFSRYSGLNRIEVGNNIRAVALGRFNSDGLASSQYGFRVGLPSFLKADTGFIRAVTDGETHNLDIQGIWTVPVPLVGDLEVNAINFYNGNNYTEIQLRKNVAKDFSIFGRAEMRDFRDPVYVGGISKRW